MSVMCTWTWFKNKDKILFVLQVNEMGVSLQDSI